ncbi:MAG: hypothetical protein NW224_06285 [Leptolyngbyaceae cyanobacterium bins.302]|nr:hypothetical protein [Leptolyngbyaceae cyanobacterium bins.302]
MSQFLAIAPSFAQSTASDRIDCIKKFRAFYRSAEGGYLSSQDALAKAEQICAEESRRNPGTTPNPVPVTNPGWSGQSGGSPAAIAQCMDKLMYRTEVQKPFPGWICVQNDVNCSTVRVRTEISEATAIQACQNAR